MVLGGLRFRPDETDLRWVGAIVSKNGRVEETGLAAGVLDHPALGIVWLANRLGARGVALEPGEILLAGSFVRPIEVGPGDVIVADYGRFGTVTSRFTGDA